MRASTKAATIARSEIGVGLVELRAQPAQGVRAPLTHRSSSVVLPDFTRTKRWSLRFGDLRGKPVFPSRYLSGHVALPLREVTSCR
jgi:hypothetical protein